MKLFEELSGGQTFIYPTALHTAGTTIVKGAAVVRGTTSGTNEGLGVVAGSSFTDVIGVTEAQLLGTVTDTNVSTPAETASNIIPVDVNPLNVYLAEYDQTATFTTSGSSGTTISGATSIDANGQGGYIYVVSGTGAGQLLLIANTNNGAATITLATAPAVALDSTSACIRILPRWGILADLNTTADKLAPALAAGGSKVTHIGGYIQSNSIPFQPLSPTTHNGLTGLSASGVNVKFFGAIRFRCHVLAPF